MSERLGAQAADAVRRHIANLNALFKPSLRRTLGLDKPDYEAALKLERELIAKFQTLREQAERGSLLARYIDAAHTAAQGLEKLTLHLLRQSRSLEKSWSRKEFKAKLAEQQGLELAYLEVGAQLNKEKGTS